MTLTDAQMIQVRRERDGGLLLIAPTAIVCISETTTGCWIHLINGDEWHIKESMQYVIDAIAKEN